MKKKIVALLPMKANSERVKGKNFRDFAGKPLFRWVLDTLLSSEMIDRVVINTDARDLLIKNGLEENGRVLIRDRSTGLCGDMVSMNKIIADDISNIKSDIYLMTHTTNPFLSRETIEGCIHQFISAKESGAADSVFTVNKVQTRFYREDCSPVNHDPDNLVRTQDLEPWFEENSNLYVFDASSFASTGARIGSKPALYISPKEEALDIDEPYDWDLGEMIARSRANSGVYA